MGSGAGGTARWEPRCFDATPVMWRDRSNQIADTSIIRMVKHYLLENRWRWSRPISQEGSVGTPSQTVWYRLSHFMQAMVRWGHTRMPSALGQVRKCADRGFDRDRHARLWANSVISRSGLLFCCQSVNRRLFSPHKATFESMSRRIVCIAACRDGSPLHRSLCDIGCGGCGQGTSDGQLRQRQRLD